MEIFDKIGQKASEAYKVTTEKTSKIAREAKLKMKINDLKSQISVLYKEIGSKVYEKYTLNENFDIQTDLEEECKRIDELSQGIENCLAECLELKDKRKCKSCFKEIDIDVNYCPNCGEKQEKIEKTQVDNNEEDTIIADDNNSTENEKIINTEDENIE